MKIDVLCVSGSPIGVVPSDLYGRGLGGSENALVCLTEAFAKRGHDVTIYNNPKSPGKHWGVNYLPLDNYTYTDPRDFLILFRVPHGSIVHATGRKLFWSCDQWTAGDYRTDIFPYVEKSICISQSHVDFFKGYYGADPNKLLSIDLGVRLEDYDVEIERIQKRAIFCSVPDRGLPQLFALWPRIIEQVPDASLVITSDYTVWGAESPGDYQHRLQWMRTANISYVGNVPRHELIKYQKSAQVMLYPCIYEENFCVSLAECQVAGAIPVISGVGALHTTREYGFMAGGKPGTGSFDAEFVAMAVAALNGAQSDERAANIEKSRKRFDWLEIAKQWEEKVFA